MTAYADFLRRVKCNEALSAEVQEKCESIRQTQGSHTGGSSSKGNEEDVQNRVLAEVSGILDSSATGITAQVEGAVGLLRQRMRAFLLLQLIIAAAILSVCYYCTGMTTDLLLGISESGTRRMFTSLAAEGIREMHIAAIQGDACAFLSARQRLIPTLDKLQSLHADLSFLQPARLPSILEYTRFPQLYLAVWASQHAPGEGSLQTKRQIATSAGDIITRLLQASYTSSMSSITRFAKFDRKNPHSFPSLWFVLENVHIATRAMDEVTIRYVAEATELLGMFTKVLAALCSLMATLEILFVAGLIHRTATRRHREIAAAITALFELDQKYVESMNKKINRKKGFSELANADGVAKAQADLTSEEAQHSADHEGSHTTAEQDSNRKSIQFLLLSMFYWGCLVVIGVAIFGLLAAGILVANELLLRVSEVNASSRRQYLESRISYLSDELVYSVNRRLSLVDGSLTWLNSTELIRCTLRQSAYALLSVHYGLLYGQAVGWELLPRAQKWMYGAVGSWLGPNWVESGRDLPSAAQVPGVEIPPTWVPSGGDFCSPFTYDHTTFLRTRDTQKSIGLFPQLDKLYFLSSCLSDLGLPADAAVYQNSRLASLLSSSTFLKPYNCYGHRSDVLLCSANPEAYPASEAVEALLSDRTLLDSCNHLASGQAGEDCAEARRRQMCAELIITADSRKAERTVRQDGRASAGLAGCSGTETVTTNDGEAISLANIEC